MAAGCPRQSRPCPRYITPHRSEHSIHGVSGGGYDIVNYVVVTAEGLSHGGSRRDRRRLHLDCPHADTDGIALAESGRIPVHIRSGAGLASYYIPYYAGS